MLSILLFSVGKIPGRFQSHPGRFFTNWEELALWAANLVARNIPSYQPKAGSKWQGGTEEAWDLSIVPALAPNVILVWQCDSLVWLRPANPPWMCEGTLCQRVVSSVTVTLMPQSPKFCSETLQMPVQYVVKQLIGRNVRTGICRFHIYDTVWQKTIVLQKFVMLVFCNTTFFRNANPVYTSIALLGCMWQTWIANNRMFLKIFINLKACAFISG